MSELPRGWVETKLPNFAELIMGQSPASSDCNDVGAGIPFFQGKAEFQKLYPEIRKFCTKPKKIAQKEDILFSVRAPVGPTNLASEDCAIGRGLSAIRAYEQADRYLLQYFRSIEPWMSQQGTGSTFKAVSGQFLKELDIKVAPLAEQKRIVEKLDEALAQVDTIKARLDGIPNLLKRFRQSVLASAVSGKLTEEWRVDNNQQVSLSYIEDAFVAGWESEKRKDFLAKGKTPKNENWKTKCPRPYLPTENEREFVGDLPATWHFTSVDQLTKFVKDGPHYSPKYVDDGIEFISGRNITINGIDFSSSKYISQELHEELSVRCKPEFNDVLLTKGGTTGVSCVNKHKHEFNVWVHVAVLRVASEEIIMPEYLSLFFNSPIGYAQSQNYTHGVANRDLGLKRMVKICLGLPPLSEQKEIVRLVDQYFALADTIEAQVKKAQARVDNLTQSVLAKAFSGELVPQGPNDEPADKLLERIAKAREEAEALAKAAKKAEAAKKRAAKATK